MAEQAQNFEVLAGVIHRIVKAQRTAANDSYTVLRDELHTVNSQLRQFVEYAETNLLNDGSNRSISGGFGRENTLSKLLADAQFECTVDTYLTLSRSFLLGLFEFVKGEGAASGGHVPIIFYRKNGIDYLLITVISLSPYQRIDDQGELLEAAVIDKDALKVGVRIDLQAMQMHYSAQSDDDELYIRWIERRGKRLPNYIQEFIPVGRRIDDKKSTNDLLSAVNSFLQKVLPDDLEAQIGIRSDVLNLLQSKLNAGELVHVEEDIDPVLDAAMSSRGLTTARFQEYRQQNQIDVDSSFTPSQAAMNNHGRFKISLPDSELTIQGKRADLGRKVKIVTNDDGAYFLRIAIEETQKEQLSMQYPDISINEHG